MTNSEQISNIKSAPHSYLLVFQANSAALVPLPEKGVLTIGSSAQATVRLTGQPIDPLRAEITVDEKGVSLVPLGNRGTISLNGSPIDGTCLLTTHDSITIGDATMVLQRKPKMSFERTVLEGEELVRRLGEECARCVRYDRQLSLLVIDLDGIDDGSLDEIFGKIGKAVRTVDIIGRTGRSEIVIIFPETGEFSHIPAQRVMNAIEMFSRGARAGLVICPADGIDPDNLLTGARQSARTAEPGGVSLFSENVTRIVCGEHHIILADPKMKRLFDLIRSLAASDIPVLISGETGSGKELVAQAIHAFSSRREKKFISINCAAVSPALLESELFGYVKGAFTGATNSKVGLFEGANGGTVFLDEISESLPRTQAELLRVLETKKIRRVGAIEEREIDIRIVAATNRNLEQEVDDDRFRKDLYYRLNAASLVVPPLRDRLLDIPVLSRTFLGAQRRQLGKDAMIISDGAMHRLRMHSWPGNVRELKNSMEYLASVVQGPTLEESDLHENIMQSTANKPRMSPRSSKSAGPADAPSAITKESKPHSFRKLSDEIRELERTRIEQALDAAGGVRVRAAEMIGMPLRTLVTKIKLYGLADRHGVRSHGVRAERKG